MLRGDVKAERGACIYFLCCDLPRGDCMEETGVKLETEECIEDCDLLHD